MNWEDLCPTLAERMANQALLLERCRSEEWRARAAAAEGERDQMLAECRRLRDNVIKDLQRRVMTLEAERDSALTSYDCALAGSVQALANLAAVIALCDESHGYPLDCADVRAAAQGQSDA